MNLAGAGIAQGCRQGIHRCAGGDDVVDNGDIHSLESTASTERAAHVPVSMPSGKQGLRPGIRLALYTANEQRQPGSGRHRPGDLKGLIESPLAQPSRVQRHGNECVHLSRHATFFQNFNQQ